MQKLTNEFYKQKNVVLIAKQLLGKILVTTINNQYTAGIITETEAYAGITDRASHAFNNRRTKRTEIMFMEGGTAYVYLCYGMHALFNVVTNEKDIPDAVLIRSIKPLEGLPIMLTRRNKEKIEKGFTNGPGNVAKALGIEVKHSSISLLNDEIWIEDRGIEPSEIKVTPRIGVDYAGDDALLPYRFLIDQLEIDLN